MKSPNQTLYLYKYKYKEYFWGYDTEKNNCNTATLQQRIYGWSQFLQPHLIFADLEIIRIFAVAKVPTQGTAIKRNNN